MRFHFLRTDVPPPAHFAAPERGGVALEYVLVSTFAAVATVAALGFVGKILKDKLNKMGSSLGIEGDAADIDPFRS